MNPELIAELVTKMHGAIPALEQAISDAQRIVADLKKAAAGVPVELAPALPPDVKL